ncbi:ABC transporter permease [Bauldia litoralis]|uniref:Ribose transport system permease protein n=1 Tax=Bauldia litoralis TaxID=665467 RepID=A0A1G6EHL8_9HYPH|nr:ABC transporter permease [Bauldia litoralis]SDB56842.1 ribose transport system permease protein [Bauldia litoralis]
MSSIRQIFEKPWIWAFVAAIGVWIATITFTQGQGAGGVLTAAFSFATFSVIVALGQMMVITLGPGNVDLSIPATMTLAGTVATKVMATQDSMIIFGLLVALGVGLGVGLVNYGLIRLLRIPPIIATLSSSFLFQSAAIWYNRGLRIKPPPLLADFATSTVWGVPVLAIFIIVLSVAIHIALHRTVYGRSVTAIGQNMRAASLAGINVNRVRFLTYILCAVFAALNGFFFSAFSGGAALNMGQTYLLNSIAVVVIGGTSVAGGFANVPGLWGAALFLFLVEAMLNTYGLGAGIRLLLTGLIIVGVITAAGGQKTAR